MLCHASPPSLQASISLFPLASFSRKKEMKQKRKYEESFVLASTKEGGGGNGPPTNSPFEVTTSVGLIEELALILNI